MIVEYTRFLRKQVTGGRNGLAGKATGMRWRLTEVAETHQSEDLLRAPLRLLGAALTKNA